MLVYISISYLNKQIIRLAIPMYNTDGFILFWSISCWYNWRHMTFIYHDKVIMEYLVICNKRVRQVVCIIYIIYCYVKKSLKNLNCVPKNLNIFLNLRYKWFFKYLIWSKCLVDFCNYKKKLHDEFYQKWSGEIIDLSKEVQDLKEKYRLWKLH